MAPQAMLEVAQEPQWQPAARGVGGWAELVGLKWPITMETLRSLRSAFRALADCRLYCGAAIFLTRPPGPGVARSRSVIMRRSANYFNVYGQ